MQFKFQAGAEALDERDGAGLRAFDVRDSAAAAFVAR